MNQPVENGIRQSRILNGGATGRWEIALLTNKSMTIAVIEEVEHLAGVIGVEPIAQPFIEQNEVKG